MIHAYLVVAISLSGLAQTIAANRSYVSDSCFQFGIYDLYKVSESFVSTEILDMLIRIHFRYEEAGTAPVVWSEILATDPEVRVRFSALPDFLRSSGSGMGSTQPREYN
jgi:hypothetical protein